MAKRNDKLERWLVTAAREAGFRIRLAASTLRRGLPVVETTHDGQVVSHLRFRRCGVLVKHANVTVEKCAFLLGGQDPSALEMALLNHWAKSADARVITQATIEEVRPDGS